MKRRSSIFFHWLLYRVYISEHGPAYTANETLKRADLGWRSYVNHYLSNIGFTQ